VTRHASLRRRALYLATPGNHERTWAELGRANWDAAMGEPAEPLRYWYAVDVPEASARFVFLDSSLLGDRRENYPDSLEDALSNEQLAWADSVLDHSGRFRFVLLHHPLVSAGHHIDDWRSDQAARRLARLLEMCVKRRVTAVLASHEHLYQRVYLRAPEGAGFWQLTTGGGGSPLYHVSPRGWREALSRPLAAGLSVDLDSAFKKSEYHICRLALPLSPSAQASVPVEVDRVYANGSTRRIDAFDLAQPPSPR
jgi:hypothetical protein